MISVKPLALGMVGGSVVFNLVAVRTHIANLGTVIADAITIMLLLLIIILRQP